MVCKLLCFVGVKGANLWPHVYMLKSSNSCCWVTILKAVILAGGLGTRISEETHLKPKPMVEIGGKPYSGTF